MHCTAGQKEPATAFAAQAKRPKEQPKQAAAAAAPAAQ